MLKIYQFASCPYCQRVLQFVDSLGLKAGKDFELVEASQGTPGRQEVIALGGLSQVPFIMDGSVKMYESLDIIDYLRKKYKA